MKLHPSKAICEALNQHEIDLYEAGFFPEVGFSSNSGCTSFSLFERLDKSKLIFRCLDLSMRKAGIEYGAFTRKHGDKFIQMIKSEILDNIKPVSSEILKSKQCVGYPIKLWGIEDKFSFREGTISGEIYMDGIIWDFACEESNGYFAETGSAYIWEIAMIEISSIWRPFHLTEEEKQIKKELYSQRGD